MRYKLLIFFMLAFVGSPLAAEPLAVAAVNGVRQAAGMQALTASRELTDAASAHARYLQRYLAPGSENIASAHEQRAGLPEFTGYLAPDRALNFGYAHSQVIENVSLGNPSIQESVSDLMSAIYHRFAFLDFSIDEIGAANAQQRYVYNMGRRNLAQTCLQQPDAAKSLVPVNCLGSQIKQSTFQAMCAAMPEQARFKPPYGGRCPNGALLDKTYMEQVCAAPPAGALLKGPGRYYDLCGNGSRISADWYNQLCAAPPPEARYPYSGSTYQICTPAVPVYAEWYQNYCANLPEIARYSSSGKYYEVCDNGFQVNSEYYDALISDTLSQQPLAVLWPANGSTNIKPVFYTEDPHPTPDLPMTGYPLSIQFNPQLVKSAQVTGFKLEYFKPGEASNWQPVQALRRIDQHNDIQQRFTSLQFAWFPLQRLKWGAHYRFRIDALIDGVVQQFNAEFTTTNLNLPLYEVHGGEPSVRVSAKHFVLYRPADSYDALPFQGIDLSYRNRPFVEANVIDSNTVEIIAGGRGCSPVLLNTRLGEEIRIDFCASGKWLNLF